MSAAEVAAQILLWTGVAAEIVSCFGVWWMRDVFDRLHYAAAAATAGPALVGGSVLLGGGAGSGAATVQAVTAAVVLMVGGPLVTHATGRAARRLLHGDIGPNPEELGDT